MRIAHRYTVEVYSRNKTDRFLVIAATTDDVKDKRKQETSCRFYFVKFIERVFSPTMPVFINEKVKN
jgi:hypothetical protein